MAVIAMNIESDYGYVILVFILSIVVLQWMSSRVTKARKKHNVQYPRMYSNTNDMFNCVQRAHQNTLEVYSIFLGSLLLGGLQFPRVSAAAGLVYLAGRIVFALGYYTGDPSKRLLGVFGYIGAVTLIANTGLLALNMLEWI